MIYIIKGLHKKDISHLTRKQIVDSKGRHQTVYVKQDDDEQPKQSHAQKWTTLRDRPFFTGTHHIGAKPPKEKGEGKKGTKVIFTKKDGTQGEKWVYSKEWEEASSKWKFSRVDKLASLDQKFHKDIRSEMNSPELTKTKATATALAVMRETGIRVASSQGETKGEPTYGMTTLEKRHVKVSGDTVTLEFRGKSGVDQTLTIKDQEIANSISSFIRDNTDPNSKIFSAAGGISYSGVTSRLKEFGEHFEPKDLRTLVANEIATAKVLDILKTSDTENIPESEKERKKMAQALVRQIGEAVSGQLNNTPSVAIEKYTNPELVEHMLSHFGFDRGMIKKAIEEARKGISMSQRFPILSWALGENVVSEWVSNLAQDNDDDEGADTGSLDRVFSGEVEKSMGHVRVVASDLEKGRKDITKLVRKVITDKAGHKRTVYVKSGEDEPKRSEAKPGLFSAISEAVSNVLGRPVGSLLGRFLPKFSWDSHGDVKSAARAALDALVEKHLKASEKPGKEKYERSHLDRAKVAESQISEKTQPAQEKEKKERKLTERVTKRDLLDLVRALASVAGDHETLAKFEEKFSAKKESVEVVPEKKEESVSKPSKDATGEELGEPEKKVSSALEAAKPPSLSEQASGGPSKPSVVATPAVVEDSTVGLGSYSVVKASRELEKQLVKISDPEEFKRAVESGGGKVLSEKLPKDKYGRGEHVITVEMPDGGTKAFSSASIEGTPNFSRVRDQKESPHLCGYEETVAQDLGPTDGWQKESFTISQVDGSVELEVSGMRSGMWGVHKLKGVQSYAVTHIPSGRAAFHTTKKEAAMKAVEELAEKAPGIHMATSLAALKEDIEGYEILRDIADRGRRGEYDDAIPVKATGVKAEPSARDKKIGWKHSAFDISATTTGEPIHIEHAHVLGSFAIHEPSQKSRHTDKFNITHIPSGHRVIGVETLGEAKAAIEKLREKSPEAINMTKEIALGDQKHPQFQALLDVVHGITSGEFNPRKKAVLDAKQRAEEKERMDAENRVKEIHERHRETKNPLYGKEESSTLHVMGKEAIIPNEAGQLEHLKMVSNAVKADESQAREYRDEADRLAADIATLETRQGDDAENKANKTLAIRLQKRRDVLIDDAKRLNNHARMANSYEVALVEGRHDAEYRGAPWNAEEKLVSVRAAGGTLEHTEKRHKEAIRLHATAPEYNQDRYYGLADQVFSELNGKSLEVIKSATYVLHHPQATPSQKDEAEKHLMSARKKLADAYDRKERFERKVG